MSLKKMIACGMFILATYGFNASATEYFVAKNGDDRYDGLSESNAFATVGKGVSVLAPGDVLTIGPGEYYESVVCHLTGSEDAPVTIRAKHPRTAILRGDAPLKAKFEKVEDRGFLYVCDMDDEVRGVLDSGYLSHYQRVACLDAADRTPGSYFHDVGKRQFYVHTADSSHPDKHVLSLAGTVGLYGLRVVNTEKEGRVGEPNENEWTRNLVIEGLVFRGYSQFIPKRSAREGTGLSLFLPKDCVIRDCVAFLNATGLECVGVAISRNEETDLRRESGENCLIENCAAYGNDDESGSGASIICRGSIKDSIIRNCLAFKSRKCIRFYSGALRNCAIKNNIAFGDIWEKGNLNPIKNLITGNVCERLVVYNSDTDVTRNLTASLSEVNKFGHGRDAKATIENNIIEDRTGPIDPEANFAAPERLDYRLQSDAPLRGTGRAPFPYEDTVFFVKPDGNDAAAGTSVKQAWKTLDKACRSAAPGHTIYILAGLYDETLVPENSGTEEKPIVFSDRGGGRVALKGVDLKGKSHIVIRGLSASNGEGLGVRFENGTDLTLERCVVANRSGGGVQAANVRNLQIRHCAFSENAFGVKLEKCAAALVVANIFNANSETSLQLDSDSLRTLWSDYNSFNVASENVGVVDGSPNQPYDLVAWRRSFRLDEHSLTRTPDFDDDYYLKNYYQFNGLGPLAMPVGPYERVKRRSSATVSEPVVHSATSTTVNIECVTPGALANCELHWGITPECEKRLPVPPEYFLQFTTSLHHYFSIVGLTPGSHYFYKIVASAPLIVVYSNEPPGSKNAESAPPSSGTRCFITPTVDPPPSTYHVSRKGDDKNSGLSRDEALRTIKAAAGKVKAGDTVIVGDGEYNEDIVVRGTGDRDRPVVFKTANLGKVFLNGDGLLKSAFELSHKSWIVVDGFYIKNYKSETKDICGAFSVVQGSNNSLRRLIFDGRTSIPRQTVVAKFSANLSVENCVFRNAWMDILGYGCPNALIKNNVFYGNMCGGAVAMRNNGDEKFTISHNIFCDTVPKKRFNTLVKSGHLDSIMDEYNCYFTRLPEEEKKIYTEKSDEKASYTFAEFKKLTGQGDTSFFANPNMPIIKEYEIFKGDMTDRAHKFVTQELNWKVIKEHGKTRRVPIIALYDQFFASNPKCVKAKDGLPIGLNPEVFKRTTDNRDESRAQGAGDEE